MPNTLFKFDRNTDAMRRKVAALGNLREAVQQLVNEQAIELQRRGENDGSQDAHYANLATAGGFTAGDFTTASEAARKSFEKINDLLYKLTTNASVSDMAAALAATCAQHGV